MTSSMDKLSFTKKQNFKVDWKTNIEEFLEISIFVSQDENRALWDSVAEILELLKSDTSLPLLYFSFFGDVFYFDRNSKNLVNLKVDYGKNVGIPPHSLEGQLLEVLRPFLISGQESYLQLDWPHQLQKDWLEAISESRRLVLATPHRAESQFSSVADIYYKKLVYENRDLVFNPLFKRDQNQLRCWGEFRSDLSSKEELAEDLVIDLWQVKHLKTQTLLTQGGRLFRVANFRDTKESRSFEDFGLWAQFLLEKGGFSLSISDIGDFFVYFINKWGLSNWKLPTDLGLVLKELDPQPLLYLKTPVRELVSHTKIEAQVWFRYSHIETPDFCHKSTKRRSALYSESNSDGIVIFFVNRKLESFFSQKEFHGCGEVKFDFHRSIFRVSLENAHDLISRLLEKGWIVWAENIEVKLLNDYVMGIKSKGFFFSAEFQNASKGLKFESWQIIHILKRKSAFIRLDDGTLGVLPQSWLDQLYRLYSRHLDEEPSLFDSSDWCRAVWGLQANEIIPSVGDQKFQSISEKFRDFESGKINGFFKKPSPHLNTELYPYQQEGLSWLLFINEFKLGGLLADEMGLGKTVQILAFLDFLKFNPPEDEINKRTTTFIITPKSLVSEWVKSVQKFTPQLTVTVWHPREYLHRGPRHLVNTDIVLLTYGVVRRYISYFSQEWLHRVILDEAQMIKNEKSKLSRSVKSLKVHHRLALTGTPIENHFHDIFSIFEFINPGLLKRCRFSNDRGGLTGPSIEDQKNSQREQEEMKSELKKLKPLILRRRKKDVIQSLPEKTEKTVQVLLTSEQSQLYTQVKSYYVDQLKKIHSEEEFNEYRLFFLEGILRLRQICCHPRIIFKSEETQIPLNSSKMNYLLESLKERQSLKSKALVFSQFASFLRIIRQELERQGIAFSYLDGQTQRRELVIEEFQSKDEIKVFLLGLKVGGVGLNLVAANSCFLMDPWWNPAVESQAVDRMHRIGQNKNVHVTKLITKNTIEEKIIELHKLKSKYAELVFDSEPDFFKNLNQEDFKNLFQ